MNRKSFNDNWEFTTIDTDRNIGNQWDMSMWKSVTLPHDWTTDFEFNRKAVSANQGGYVQMGIGWYRKYFMVTKEMLERELILLFDGIYHNSTVYLNGTKVGGRAYGYISFDCNITKFVKEGLNLLVVKVDCSDEPSSRWFNGAGMNRNVWLLEGEHQYIPYNGSYIYTEQVDENTYDVHTEVTIINQEKEKTGQLCVTMKHLDGTAITKKIKSIQIKEGKNQEKISLVLEDAKLWSFETPNLYVCEMTITTDQGIDCLRQQFGVRTIAFKSNEGFFLNGIHTLLKGVCLHHDGGCVGSAVPKGLWKKRILMLKEMGCNAIRTSHNPFNPEFYDICDEVGMLVMDEAFDSWDIPKAQFDYGTVWEDCYEKDLTDFILRDRNHPCIFLWSVGNEILKMKPELTKTLMEIVRNLDPTRSITAGINDITDISDANRAVLDIAGYNDGGGACFLYEEDHEKRPNQVLVATEAPHTLQTRGYYRTKTWWRDKNQPRWEIENLTEEELFFDQNKFYHSSYDNAGVRTCTRDSWSIVETHLYLFGEFRWTGFDYIGEAAKPTWPTRTNNYGVIDLANFEKDHYYLYQSMWSDEKMIHLLPHWTHRYMEVGTKIPVWVYTNCEEAELFLNGVSLGKKQKGQAKQLEWLVPYEEGTLQAIGYENGEALVRKSQVTAFTPECVNVSVEELPDDNGTKVAQWSFCVLDKNKTMVPYANNVTGLYLSPDCKLIGSDNGAIDDMSFWKSPIRRAFNGLGMYLVQYQKDAKQVYGAIGFIGGDPYFDEETWVTLGVSSIQNSLSQVQNYEIYYTLDGSKPDKESTKYQQSFRITESTYIQMSVYKDQECILLLKEVFTKGRLDPVIDLDHLNDTVDLEKTAGPCVNELVGIWKWEGITYRLSENGIFSRILGMQENQLGYWWYDMSHDVGKGALWFATGEICPIQLTDSSAKEFQLENTNNVIRLTYGTKPQLYFTKQEGAS